ncbi:hypothetical protein PTKIN_Ptkin03bG0079300 [Pterospermum kingtungense]
MDSKPSPVYQDLEVHTEWVHEALEDTLIAYLPGFSTEQLKVQITSVGKLRIAGERPDGVDKISRFSKEIPIPSNCDQNKIKANFRGGMLHIKHPKLIVPADDQKQELQAKPSADTPTKSGQTVPQRPPTPRTADVPPKQALQEAPPKTTMEKQMGDDQKTDGLAKVADNVSEKEMKDDISNSAANGSDKPMGMEKKGWDQEEKTSTIEKREKDAAEKENIIADAKKFDGSTDKNQLGINRVPLKYKEAVDGLAMGQKNPRKMMNMVLVVLVVVVLGVYLRNAIRFLGNY